MPKTFEELLSDKISARLNELDEIGETWIKYPALRDSVESLFVVRAYAHLEGSVKESANMYLDLYAGMPAHKLKPSYWLLRERAAFDRAVAETKPFTQISATKSVLGAMKSRTVKRIDIVHEYNQMYSDRIVEIYVGLGLSTSKIRHHSITLDDIVRKRHLVAHGNGLLPKLGSTTIRRFRDAVDETLIDLWAQLCVAHSGSTLKKR